MNVSKWLKYLSLLGCTALISGAELWSSQSAQAQTVVRPFTTRYQNKARGNISLIGNTLMTCDTNNTRIIGDDCPNVRNGNGTYRANNFFFMRYVDIDGNSNTFNSSSSRLTIPNGATIAWAGLYWSGDLSAGQRDTLTNQGGQVYSAGQPARNANLNGQAQLQVPGNGYQQITADNIDQQGSRYSAFADVTSIVKAAGNGNYTMANVQAGTGGDRYAGWSLIVVYEDSNELLRSLNVFDGFAFVAPSGDGEGSISTTVSGFETPANDAFEVELGAVVYEGDLQLTGDQFKVNNINLADGLNAATNFFNSSNTRLGTRFANKNPDYENQLAIDINTVDATGILSPGDTSALLEFTSQGDIYYPTALTFTTEIKQPILTQNFTKTAIDVNGGVTVAGDILEYEITLENTGNGTAVNTIISDPIPENTTLVDGSLEVIQDPNSSNIGIKTNASNDDTAELSGNNSVLFRVGNGADATNGGNLAPGESVTVRFQVQIDPQLDSSSNISNQASVNFNSELSGNAFSGVSDDPNTSEEEDATNIQAIKPVVCNDREIIELAFTNPQLESGTNLQVGATYRFSDVASGIDAIVTIDAFNNGASLNSFDNTGLGSNNAFQPELSPSTQPDSSVDFTITFVEGRTNNPVSVNAFNASGIDIDGALNSSEGLNIREYIQLEGFVSYILENPTSLIATYDSPTGQFESSTTDTQPDINLDATETIVSGEFTNESSFRYRIGALNEGNIIRRLNSLSFECIEFNNPQRNSTSSLDFGDGPADGSAAPNGGTTAYGSASHIIVNGIQLGTNIDAESAVQSSANADGDDNDGTNDDDGITIPNLVQGQTATITAEVAGAGGYLQGWIDWNGNGSFDAGEQVATNIQDNGAGDTDNTAGRISFEVNVPADAITTSDTFARFRWSTTPGLDTTTTAENGEVEDYQVAIAAANSTPPVISCPANFDLVSFNWSPDNDPQKGLVWSNSTINSYNINGSLITATLDRRGSSSSLNNGDIFTGAFPPPGSGLTWFMDTPSNDNTQNASFTITFDFPVPVSQFVIADVDASNSNNPTAWHDQLKVSASNSGNPLPVLLTPDNPNIITIINDNTAYAADGVGQVNNGSPDGNLTTTINGFIDTIVIEYQDGPRSNSNPDRHGIGVGSFIACYPRLDLGDAPDTDPGTGQGNYQTLTTDNGAVHQIVSGIQLGAIVDSDNGSLQNSDATADDTDNTSNDDDGVTLNNSSFQSQSLTTGDNITLDVATQGDGLLNAWIDWNGDGEFQDNEQIADNVSPSNNAISLPVNVPSNAELGNTFARFRYSTDADLAPTGIANDGEVEDYQVAIASAPATVPPAADSCPASPIGLVDFGVSNFNVERGDGRNEGDAVRYPSVGTINGRSVDIVATVIDLTAENNTIYPLQNHGTRTDGTTGQISAVATIDDSPKGVMTIAEIRYDLVDSETNELINSSFEVEISDIDGKPKRIESMMVPLNEFDSYFVSNPTNIELSTNNNNLVVTGGSDQNNGEPEGAIKFIYQDTGSFTFTYRKIEPNPDDDSLQRAAFFPDFTFFSSLGSCPRYDYGDAPDTSNGTGASNYETLQENNGPYHQIVDGIYLGASEPDADNNGTPTADANGDDLSNTNVTFDDDDGVQLDSSQLQGQTLNAGDSIVLNIATSGSGVLNAWIDWNGDGDFLDDGEQIATNAAEGGALDSDNNTPGIQLNVTVPDNATVGNTIARFRYSTDTDLTPNGGASDGEIEDYQIEIAGPSNPNLLLVKRITAINPGQADEIQYNSFVDDDTTARPTENDNDPNWPENDNTYLPGAIEIDRNNTVVEPGDEVEYTIYFLSNGQQAASNVKICDVIPDNMSFVADSNNSNSGISLLNSSTSSTTPTNLSNAADSDGGTFYAPGINPPTVGDPPTNLCYKADAEGNITSVGPAENGAENTNGAIVVEIDSLPEATAPGTPFNSYGFIRFRARVQ